MIMCQHKIPLSERVYEAIREIEREKIVSNIFPYHALLIKDLCEKLKIPTVDIYWACVELYKQGMITGGNTVNDKYFKVL